MGPWWRRLMRSSQLMSLKKGCAFTRPAPPLMLPRRRERSMVQKDRIMSFASGDIGWSWGNVTGFSTILVAKGC
jgi:hypothetical protein